MTIHYHRSLGILFGAGLLLIIAAARILRMSDMSLNPDEIWSVWQTFGTPAQIIQWTPYDWPPLYYLTLGAWRGLTSADPVMLRFLSALVFVLGAACMFRVMRRSISPQAGWMAALVYAALGYSGWLTLEIRGYALLMGLLPLAMWLTLRYFDHPGWRRTWPLAVALAAMFYISVTSAFAVIMLGLYTLLVYRRRVRHWWRPGVVAFLLALPEISAKLRLSIERTEATRQQISPPFIEGLGRLYADFIGDGLLSGVALFTIATAALVVRRQALRPTGLATLLWIIAMPILMYVLNPLLAFFSPRYSWWIMMGLAVWVGWGLALLPRPGIWGSGAVLALLLFYPLPTRYNIFEHNSELGVNFEWLRRHMVSGDVVLIDPQVQCGGPEEWDYYLRLYFPTGLTFVTEPHGYRRVWYAAADGQQMPDVQAQVSAGRITERFIGAPRCQFRLYEAPPNPDGMLFENGMRFHGADIMEDDRPWFGPLARREGETVRLRLWWSAPEPIELDYSVGAYILRGSDQLIAEDNAPPRLVYPQGAPSETSRWTSGFFYVEERELRLPYPLRGGALGLYLAVYHWQDRVRIAAPGANADGLLPLQTLFVKAY